MLLVGMECGDSLRIGDEIKIVLIRRAGKYTVVGIDCPKSIKIHRRESHAGVKQKIHIESGKCGEGSGEKSG